ncbi:hypothetical protein FISHEDRAFT_56725 [Fistulina hepatica ATCC 64428]|uniref:Sm domain-containing protein n=1 Tax=Fistulina hepatica ATCC 64428 TaxID=1128425 RepID=A0A0D7AIR7_9AGAR|nr:hypothetical protein FISHEDRAFT_56725 [Fistulina hepatica ATCC 64428]
MSASPTINACRLPPPSSTPATERLKALLSKTLRVTVSDGRVFLGNFAGTDKPLNILLVNAVEFRVSEQLWPGGGAISQPSSGNTEKIYTSRYVGQIMVPWRLITRIEAQGPSDDSELYT